MNPFIVGTSILVVLPFYLRVMNIDNKHYSYELYSILAPLYFGLMNVLAYHLSLRYGSFRGYLLTTFISVAIVFSINLYSKMYPFTTSSQWLKYLARLLGAHGFTYLVVLRTLSRMD